MFVVLLLCLQNIHIALLLASMNGHTEVVTNLVEHQVDINVDDLVITTIDLWYIV